MVEFLGKRQWILCDGADTHSHCPGPSQTSGSWPRYVVRSERRPMKPAGKALTWALVVPKTVRGRGINRSAAHFTTKRRAL